MYAVVGLGNPGEEYARTRHNAGFMAVDRLADELGVHYWKTECGSLTAKAAIDGEEVVLAKPQSFMNVSGGPVKQVLSTYRLKPDHLIVIHDDLESPAGSVRVKRGGGHAGHNGLRSICDKLCTHDFIRVRCGIGRPPGKMQVAKFVLAEVRKHDLEQLEAECDEAAQAAAFLVAHSFEAAERRWR
jgi:PTH1 family peptidyl-tRNA hydrolase